MHMAVGSPPLAFMRSFTRAPLDPVFWLHHCNVDRLWEVWIQRDPAHVNPTDPAWLNEVFKFHDATGGNGDMTPRQVLNTRTPPLSYEYDDTSDPLAAGP
jgi:tyrosinase